MGVLACNRRGCENIMCDRYSTQYGYICDECFNELVSMGRYADIYYFMNQKKQNIDPFDSFSVYDEEFKLRH